MCNLSQGIIERTVEKTEEKTILNMRREGCSLEQIARVVEKTVDEVEDIIKKRELVLV